MGTEYFKRGIYSPFFPSKCSLFHNSNVFSSCIIHILYTGCAKILKNNSSAKRLITDTFKSSSIQQIWVLNILNVVYTLFFSFKMQFVSQF